jgi:hypothetical protein
MGGMMGGSSEGSWTWSSPTRHTARESRAPYCFFLSRRSERWQVKARAERRTVTRHAVLTRAQARAHSLTLTRHCLLAAAQSR